MPTDLIVPFLVVIGLVLGGYWVVSLLRHRDIETATESTANTAFSVVTGFIAAGVIFLGELAAALHSVGMMLFPDPGMISTGLIAVAGHLTLSGVVNLNPETWALLVIIAVVAGHMIRGR